MNRSVVCLIVGMSGLLAQTCIAGPREQVAVAEAVVWADQNRFPGIPADSFQSSAPPGLSASGPIASLAEELKAARKETENLSRQLDEIKSERSELMALNRKLQEQLDSLDGQSEVARGLPPAPPTERPRELLNDGYSQPAVSEPIVINVCDGSVCIPLFAKRVGPDNFETPVPDVDWDKGVIITIQVGPETFEGILISKDDAKCIWAIKEKSPGEEPYRAPLPPDKSDEPTKEPSQGPSKTVEERPKIAIEFLTPMEDAGPSAKGGIAGVDPGSANHGRMVVTLFTGEKVYGKGWCHNCPPLKAKYGSGNHDVLVIVSEDAATPLVGETTTYPALRFIDDGGVERYPSKMVGRQQQHYCPESLEELARLLERNHCQREGVAKFAAAGIGGKIQAKPWIQSAIDGWKKHIWDPADGGKSVEVQFAWLRTGAQSFPFIHQQPGQWSPKNIFGSLGEFSFEAPGSKLPVQPLRLGYRRDLDQFTLTGQVTVPESLIVSGNARPENRPDSRPDKTLVDPRANDQQGVVTDERQLFGKSSDADRQPIEASGQPAQFGPLAALTVISTIYQIAQAMQVSCDLTLGGQITATAFYDAAHDAIQIDFQDMPTIKLVLLWKFDLGIKRAIVSTTNVHLDFVGSWWIQSRDFPVN